MAVTLTDAQLSAGMMLTGATGSTYWTLHLNLSWAGFSAS